MALTNKISLIIVAVVAQLMFFGPARADDLQRHRNVTQQESVTTPERERTEMTLVRSEPWMVEGEVVGVLAGYVYKDVSTQRAVDYWELYDDAGDLLAVTWFDKFGIQRTAVDRGIVEEADKLEGLFVVILEGETI
jgi:hypothetical protein